MQTKGKLAFVTPRFAEGGTVGGAETLLRALADHAADAGWQVELLTTCATNHFTWQNELPAGSRRIDNVTVHFFPVDGGRDVSGFMNLQAAICRGSAVSRADEEAWIAGSVNSAALCEHLRRHAGDFDRIILGPYLFGVPWFASCVAPEKTLLVPCLHDEPFATLTIMRDLFTRVRGCLFNSAPEQQLARRLFSLPESRGAMVGMGLDSFEADPQAFAARHRLSQPYVLYAGRREGGKGTPLLTDYIHAFRGRTGMDLKLVLAGSGPVEAPDELRPYILDVGYVSEQEKHEAMAGAKAFIHPSTFESQGIVLLESFLAGTPALVHAGSEVLSWQCRVGKAGLWFRNYPEFEEELLLLLSNEPLRQAMGRNGRQYVQQEYAWPVVSQRFERALAEI
jgi:glycosyltransferase involved in cell wall biosynthesis